MNWLKILNYPVDSIWVEYCSRVSFFLISWVLTLMYFLNWIQKVNMDDRFGDVMLNNLRSRGCSLAGVDACISLDTQIDRSAQCLCNIKQLKVSNNNIIDTQVHQLWLDWRKSLGHGASIRQCSRARETANWKAWNARWGWASSAIVSTLLYFNCLDRWDLSGYRIDVSVQREFSYSIFLLSKSMLIVVLLLQISEWTKRQSR